MEFKEFANFLINKGIMATSNGSRYTFLYENKLYGFQVIEGMIPRSSCSIKTVCHYDGHLEFEMHDFLDQLHH